MVAVRSQLPGLPDEASPEFRRPDPADWLTLQQAACELNISVSTARRMIRKGRLRNRIVPRRGGFAYLIYLPDSRHARAINGHSCSDPAANVIQLADHRPASPAIETDNNDQVRALEAQVERLSEALSRALRLKQRQLPPGMGAQRPEDPYARYRWLVRRRRWWPFGT